MTIDSLAPSFPGKGFTLIELLMVIAIVAVIAAILLPVFLRAKMSAYEATALSDGHQLSYANLLYSGDYDDVFCPYFSGFDPGTRTYGGIQQYWPQLVCAYISPVKGHGNLGQALADDLPKVFFDPLKPFRSQYLSSFRYGIISSWGVSDDIANWFAPVGVSPTKVPASLYQVRSPSNCIHLVETYDWLLNEGFPGDAISLSIFDANGDGAAISVDAPYGTSYVKNSVTQPADPKGRNVVVYCDGHARAVAVGSISNSPQVWSINGNGTWP